MDRQHVSTAELVGRLGQKPDLKHTDAGVPYVQLSMATTERFTNDAGQIHQKTEWHRAVAWGPVAEQIAGTFDKGDAVALSGTMRINTYEKDGHKNRITELQVDKAEPSPDKSLSKNEARIVGVVREDAKAIDTTSGTSLTSLSIATRINVNGREREDWHRVALWGKTAEAARDVKAGDTIAINGALRHKTFTAPDGQEHKRSTIDGRQFQVLERAPEKTIEPRVRRQGKVLDRGM
jgi:single-strand DNA-binding protein